MEEEVNSVVVAPCRNSPEWNDYVLSLLREDEMFQGYPKVDGLRRIAEDLLGPIVSSGPAVIQCATNDNDRRCTVVYSLVFSTEEGEKEFSAAADAGRDNTGGDFADYTTAIADTRAEGRALRRALNLRTVVAEELNLNSAAPQFQAPVFDAGLITDAQKSSLKKLCGAGARGMDISIPKLVANLLDKPVVELTKEDGAALLKAVTEMQRDESLITEDIKGYEEW